MSQSPQMKIAIVGQFSSGKSALINALLRKHIVPMGVEPKTAALHRIGWDKAEICELLHQDGSREAVDFAVLEELTGDTKKTKGLEAIRIGLPESFLKDVELWDTPGFGSLNLSHEIAARRALADADLALWVTPIDAAITKEEREKLARLKHYETPVILVVNKADLADEDELEEAVEDIAESAGASINQVIWTSCKVALDDIDQASGSRAKGSGFERLDETILEAVLQWRQDQKKREEARQSLVGLSANDIRCDACDGICRHDDRFCECGADLAKYHRACPRCDTDNVTRRTRCRGCNLVFREYEQALEFSHRAQEELELGMLMEALASLQVALSYDPSNEGYQGSCAKLERDIERIEALLREGSRATQSGLTIREWSTARQLVIDCGASTVQIDHQLRGLCIAWGEGAIQRAQRDPDSIDMLTHAHEGFTVVDWVRAFVAVDRELGEISKTLRGLKEQGQALKVKKDEEERRRVEEEKRRVEEEKRRVEEEKRRAEEERRRAEEEETRRRAEEERRRAQEEQLRIAEFREANSYQINITKEISGGFWRTNRTVTGALKMIYCPAGECWMGEDGDYDKPLHRVQITRPFWIGETQVTQALWEALMGSNPSHFKGPQLPVEQVSWFDCVRFLNALSEAEGLTPVYRVGAGEIPIVDMTWEADGYRLPTEAEWEYSAKAGTELTYSGSDSIDEVAWYSKNSGGKTHPVGQKKASYWWLYDMSGNVWEWCTDEWDSDRYIKRGMGTTRDPRPYNSAPAPRVLRGGCWWYGPDYCRVACRGGRGPDDRWNDLGFRFLRWNFDS